MTSRTASRPALIVAPHADDETIGCGAVIIRKVAAGTKVGVVVVSDGGARHPADRGAYIDRRRTECVEACRRLGVGAEDVTFLGVRDGALDEHLTVIEQGLAHLIETFRPAEVFVPSAVDAHADHRAVSTAVAALRAGPLAQADVFEYPVWYWNRWAWTEPRASRPRQLAELLWRPLWHTITCHPRLVSIRGVEDQKRYALAAHESQVGKPGTNSSGLDAAWLETFLRRAEIFFAVQEPCRR